ncbi:hypothetical protein [Conchiformibius kuhniae]|uniref:Uncharacterized protein n=1 Tax=Conchiformibius kuhniae TaxID=211502 RepID=A0A8T9MX02_9NEIS|nr:hypothetical protein [Conchiformibius kuhniae]UOP04742.1 hypothetical protein LVJ77_11320 [Conchiformibius kuhniae]
MLKHYCLAGCMMFALAAANAQTAAQTLLKTNETPPAGTNGYAALHLFPYHTTPQQQAEWLRHPHTATDWEKLPHETDFACPNKYDTDACTAHVRTHLPVFQAALPRHRAVLDNLDSLAQSDHISVPPQHFETALLETTHFPAYATLLQTGRAAAITEWLSGKAQDALSRSCRHIKIGRMMLAHPQGLVQSATGNALIRQHTELFAHILAQHPESAHRLPASCTAVFAPLPEQDMGLCRAMKYEYRSLANDMTADRPQTSGIPARLGAYWHGFKIKVLLRENAEHAAFVCTDDALAQLRGDAPFQTPVPRFSLGK